MKPLFFNWTAIVTETKDDPIKCVQLLKLHQQDRILKYGLRRKLVGNNFLLNPSAILEDRTTDILYIYQYLTLASLRDYSLYSLYGMKSLALSYYPDLKLDSLKTNPLLNVTNTDIYLQYEEQNGTSI